MIELLHSIDVSIFRLLNDKLSNPFFDAVMPFITNPRNFSIVGVLLWVSLIICGGRKGRIGAWILILLVVVTDNLSSYVIKPALGRRRPYAVLEGVHLHKSGAWMTTDEPLTEEKISYSLPSNHAANVFAAAFFLWYLFRKNWRWGFIVVVRYTSTTVTDQRSPTI